ncbi:MAG: TetR/AcrR family transcriptional regulator [Pseudomonadota bacterium]
MMNDIAAEAGVARQTLYNSFPNKDEVVKATVRQFGERAVARFSEDARTGLTLGEQLDLAYAILSKEPFDVIRSSPHADELILGINAAAEAELAETSKMMCAVLADVLAPHAANIESRGVSVPVLADYIEASLKNIKYTAEDAEHLARLYAALRAAVLALAAQD